MLIGAPLSGNTIIIDDVITAGTAYREADSQIKAAGGTVLALIIALDRCEYGENNTSAIEDIRLQGVEVHSLINFHDLVHYLQRVGQYEQVAAMTQYHENYGI